jgi:hypothetical protein
MSPVAIGVLRVLGPIVLGYLLGGIPFGVMITRVFFKADITALGSGNTGGTNVYRNFGWGPAIAVGLLDVAKAAVPTLVGFMLADPAWGPDARDWVAIAAGLAAAAGHSYSPYFRLRAHGHDLQDRVGVVDADRAGTAVRDHDPVSGPHTPAGRVGGRAGVRGVEAPHEHREAYEGGRT